VKSRNSEVLKIYSWCTYRRWDSSCGISRER